MVYKYKHFIPQNIAPKGITRIAVYNSNNEKMCTIPLGRLKPTESEKLYSFGALSDVHMYQPQYTTALADFQKALQYAHQVRKRYGFLHTPLHIFHRQKSRHGHS